jgi:hypothetical protein
MMKYSKEKAEAIKILFAEILETNEELEKNKANREIQFELDGGTFPAIYVRFWDWTAENNPRETFEVSLEGKDEGERRRSLSALSKKVKDWRERFGYSEKENEGTL